jgi:hypothetical protein
MASQMTEVGYQRGVATLRNRRAEIARDIARLQLQVRHCRRELAQVDAVPRVLAPGSDPTTIPSKKPPQSVHLLRHGQLGRVVLEVLRASGRLTSNREITRATMDQRRVR